MTECHITAFKTICDYQTGHSGGTFHSNVYHPSGQDYLNVGRAYLVVMDIRANLVLDNANVPVRKCLGA